MNMLCQTTIFQYLSNITDTVLNIDYVLLWGLIFNWDLIQYLLVCGIRNETDTSEEIWMRYQNRTSKMEPSSLTFVILR